MVTQDEDEMPLGKILPTFLKIFRFLYQIQVEHIESVCSLESVLYFISICSVRIRSKKRDIFKKPKLS